jgi:DNA-binding HxlR family transcriptional regulator
VRRTRFDDWPCPIARTADLLGDWWTPLVLREAFFGVRRFEDFQERLAIPRASLTQRLGRLVDEGLLDKVAYEARPPRFEYRLTDKGRAAWDVLAAMWRFGEDWMFEASEGAQVRLSDRDTGATIHPVVVDEATGVRLDIRRIKVRSKRSEVRATAAPPRPEQP